MEEEGGMNSLPTKERANLYIQIMTFLWKVELYVYLCMYDHQVHTLVICGHIDILLD